MKLNPPDPHHTPHTTPIARRVRMQEELARDSWAWPESIEKVEISAMMQLYTGRCFGGCGGYSAGPLLLRLSLLLLVSSSELNTITAVLAGAAKATVLACLPPPSSVHSPLDAPHSGNYAWVVGGWMKNLRFAIRIHSWNKIQLFVVASHRPNMTIEPPALGASAKAAPDEVVVTGWRRTATEQYKRPQLYTFCLN